MKCRAESWDLNRYAYVYNGNSKKCRYCDEEETVEHVLYHCYKYKKERTKLFRELKRIQMKNINMNEIIRKYNLIKIISENEVKMIIDLFIKKVLEIRHVDKDVSLDIIQ